MSAGRMTRADRDRLIKLARQRARLAKSEAVEREKILLAEVHDQMAAEFSAQDKLWAAAVAIAKDAAAKANDLIRAQCIDLGIEAKYAPELSIAWRPRSECFTDSERRAELRRLAGTRLAALTQAAKTEIDRACLQTETELVRDGLDSSEAVRYLEAMPTADDLMPVIGLDDLGVKRWQPAVNAAAELLTPLTPAGRGEGVIRAIAANPGASDREIGRIARADHKTVAAYRRDRGELPAPGGEIPTAGESEDE